MRWIWWGLLAVVLLAGCAVRGPSLQVVPDRLELAPGEEAPLAVRLDGLDGGVIWSTEHGTIVGEGLEVVYRAPDYPVEDVVTVVSAENPRLRAEARILITGGEALGARIEIVSDQALVFTRAGEQRRIVVRVYDAAGKLLDGAEPVFTSADPGAFVIESNGDGSAVVTALEDRVQSVPITVSYEGRESRATAVFARLQPGVRRLPEGLFLDGDWGGAGWTILVLRRSPETESLQPGTVFFGGDAEALWGRVDAVETGDDAVTLYVSPVRLEEVFRDVDYRAEVPLLRVGADWHDDLLQARAGNVLRTGKGESCAGVEAGLTGGEEVGGALAVKIRINDGHLQEGEARLELKDSLTSGTRARLPDGQVDCELFAWKIGLARFSLLLARVETDLESALGLRVGGEGEAVLDLPQVSIATDARLLLKYRDGGWKLDSSVVQKVEPPAAAPRVEGAAGGSYEGGPFQKLGIDLRLLLPGRDATLASAGLQSELVWRVRLDDESPELAGYRGTWWELERRLQTTPGEREEEVVASSPRVWLEADPGQAGRLDLGSLAEDRTVRFSFGSEPPATGTAEVWIEGGVCEDPGCFGGRLRRLGGTGLDGQVVWRPTKEERGVYRAYARLRADDLSRDYPYAAGPWTVVITSPDMAELPLNLTLVGGYGGPALGVIDYFNRPLFGVGPDGERVQLTSPLQVWLPANGLLAEPASLTTRAGRWGYQQVSYRCPDSGQPPEQELHLYSNDPEMSEVILPVRVRCGAARLPRPRLTSGVRAGAAPLEIVWDVAVDGAGEEEWCRLDFGDGSQPLEWPAGECPGEASVTHTYRDPGSYAAVLLVGDADGPRVLARASVEVK